MKNANENNDIKGFLPALPSLRRTPTEPRLEARRSQRARTSSAGQCRRGSSRLRTLQRRDISIEFDRCAITDAEGEKGYRVGGI